MLPIAGGIGPRGHGNEAAGGRWDRRDDIAGEPAEEPGVAARASHPRVSGCVVMPYAADRGHSGGQVVILDEDAIRGDLGYSALVAAHDQKIPG